ncbi:hypothetical protein E2493_17770 [Sphingomonas parva]|uniref:Uncharacterized protein n=1 Tax=Sphingomonas parva TaxID=2555898 RepID=A0A4Y8ZP34_9SPHN|nr:hypothetical protein [Sphingomonas parva]TFI56915.1 hypothetical protein E2493_17770 [Sphingomonas parva]
MAQENVPFLIGTADAGAEIAQLRQVLVLVEEIAGRTPARLDDGALDEAARVSAAYGVALPIVQKRFDALAAETATWAAAGVEALMKISADGRPTGPAAGRLADELRKALARLRDIVSA